VQPLIKCVRARASPGISNSAGERNGSRAKKGLSPIEKERERETLELLNKENPNLARVES